MKQTKRSTFKLLFYLKKNAPKKDASIPIMARITIDSKIAQFSTKLSIDVKKWDLKYGRVIGRNQQAESINQKLDSIRACINQTYNDLLFQEGFVSAQKVKNIFLGIGVENDAILPFFEEHNENIKNNIAPLTYNKHLITYKHLTNFIQFKYNNKDIRFRELNDRFFIEFEEYLRYTIGLCHNSVWIYMLSFMKIVRSAVRKDIIPKLPFVEYSITNEETDRNFLTKEEIQQFYAVTPKNKTEELVQDLFIFSCFTGLAFIDIKNLKKNELQTFLDDSLWIIKRRQKTANSSNIRVLDIPMKIIQKYQDFSDEFALPVPSKPTITKSLKTLQNKANISKHITFHVARHSFATLFLSENVPLESVSKMMGHKNITTTLIYAKITNQKISRDLDKLEIQLKPMEQEMLAQK